MNRDRDDKGRFLKDKSRFVPTITVGRKVKTTIHTNSLEGRILKGESIGKALASNLKIKPSPKDSIEHWYPIAIVLEPLIFPTYPIIEEFFLNESGKKPKFEEFKLIFEPNSQHLDI